MSRFPSSGTPRLDAIRDSGSRTQGIARDLVEHGARRALTQRELTWLREELCFGGRSVPIPFLRPEEYDALIRALVIQVRMSDAPKDLEK